MLIFFKIILTPFQKQITFHQI
jgi:hypothetical protein